MDGPRSAGADDARQRLMVAAAELVARSGGIDATVQQVSSAAGISKKTFYVHFADKDSFFYEFWTERLAGIARDLATRAASEPDPLERIRVFVRTLFSPPVLPAARGMSEYQSRLAGTAPAKIAPALRPLFELLAELIAGAQEAGMAEGGDPHELAGPVLELTVAAARAHIDGSTVLPVPLGPDDVVRFGLRALGARG